MSNDQAVQLIDKAEKEFGSTTIKFSDYTNRVTSGYYKNKSIDPITGTSWGRGFKCLEDAKTVLAPTPPPASTGKTMSIFRTSLQPGGYELTPGDGYNFAWVNFHSDVTPRHSLNGDPDARYIGAEDHFYILKYLKILSGAPGRWFNGHNVAGDSGWNGVSAFASDIGYNPGHSGKRFEWIFEYERAQDLDDEPHSGGAHWGVTDNVLDNNGRWYAIEFVAGQNEDGMFSMADWITGETYVHVTGINTLMPGSRLMQLWEGNYIRSTSVQPSMTEQSAALFSTKSFADCLKDNPVLVDNWHSQGPSPQSMITLDVRKLEVPVGKFM